MFKFLKKQISISLLDNAKRLNTTCVKHPNDSILFRQVSKKKLHSIKFL